MISKSIRQIGLVCIADSVYPHMRKGRWSPSLLQFEHHYYLLQALDTGGIVGIVSVDSERKLEGTAGVET